MVVIPESQHIKDGMSFKELHAALCNKALKYRETLEFDFSNFLIDDALEFYKAHWTGPELPSCGDDCRWIYKYHRKCAYSGKQAGCRFHINYNAKDERKRQGLNNANNLRSE